MQGFSGSLKIGFSVELNELFKSPQEKSVVLLLTLFYIALCEWITHIILWATANRTVINDLAISFDSACSGTRVNTFLVITSSILRAVGTDNTFWPTCWRTANIIFTT